MRDEKSISGCLQTLVSNLEQSIPITNSFALLRLALPTSSHGTDFQYYLTIICLKRHSLTNRLTAMFKALLGSKPYIPSRP